MSLMTEPNILIAARNAEEQRRIASDERADEYRRLLGAVYSFTASDIAAYGGRELDTEVRHALGLPVEDTL